MGRARAIPALAAAALLAGCATYVDETGGLRADWRSGNLKAAAQKAAELSAEAEGSGDELVFLLENGAVSRAAADFGQSRKSFDRAEQIMAERDARGGAGAGDEIAAILANQSYLPYSGYNYDRIMAAAYQAMNLIELKEFEAAEVWLKKLENFQADAGAKNAARIDAEMRAIQKAQAEGGKRKYDVSRTLADAGVRGALAQYYGADFLAPDAAVRARAVYANPFAYWLSGLYFSNRPADASDKSRAADFFRLANQSLPGGNYVAASDAARAEALADGRAAAMGDFTYAIFEEGCAPLRRQFRVDLPLYIFADALPHVGVNFPYLAPADSGVRPPAFSGGGKTAKFAKIADMDEIVSREFRDGLPVVVARSILSAAVKAGAQFAAQYAVRDNSAALLLVAIAGSAYQAATNDADLRSWTTLPKAVYLAKLPTPRDGIVEIGGRKVSVDTSGVNVIVAKQISSASPLFVRKFNFKEK